MQEFDQREFEDTLELKDIIRLIKKHKGIIAVSTIFVLFIAVYITFSTTPSYEASIVVLIEEAQGNEEFFSFDLGTGANYLNDQIEVLTSRSLAERVIDSLWSSPYRNTLYALGTKHFDAPTADMNYWMKQIFSLGLYEPTERIPINTDQVIPDSLFRSFANGLQQSIEVSNKRETNTVTITYKNPDPVEAAFIANLIVEIYSKNDQSWRSNEIVKMKEFIERQLAVITSELNNAENKLKLFQETEGVYTIDGNSDILLEELSKYESSYYTALAEVNVFENQIKHVKEMLNESESKLVNDIINTADPRIQELRTQLAELEAQKVQTLVDVGMDENNRAIIELQTKITNLRKNIEIETTGFLLDGIPIENPIVFSQDLQLKIIELNSSLIQVQSRSAEYKILVDKLIRQVQHLPDKTITLARLTREKKVKEELYLLLSQKLEETRITEASQTMQTRVIDPAIPPKNPKTPKKQLNLLLGLILGAGLGMGVAFLIEYSDNTLRSIDAIQKKGLSVIGIVPKIGEHYRGKKGRRRSSNKKRKKKDKAKTGLSSTDHFAERLISHFEPKSPVSEAYRSIRTNLTYALPDKEIKTLIVTSPSAGEGKSTTIINLAITFAQLGKKTLLIDTDLRKPVIHKVFNIDREPGVTNYLVGFEGSENIEEYFHDTEVENLQIVTSGKLFPNPSELLGSKKMKELIVKLKNQFDMILFDSPPIMPVTDARMLSKELDGMVLIVKSGETETMALDRALSLLKTVNAPLVGGVLNSFSQRDSYYYSDYQYYYYYEYYDYSEDEKS